MSLVIKRQFRWRSLLLLPAVLLVFNGCSSSPHPTPTYREPNTSTAPETGYQARGKASYYGSRHHGRKTASGERFNKNALTAAHRNLPFGTRVKVTNLRNHKTVVVRINDRGPYSRGRIIDLSEQAAKELNLVQAGVGPVEIVELK